MINNKLTIIVFALVATAWRASGFVVVAPSNKQSSTTTLNEHDSRREFVAASFGAVIGVLSYQDAAFAVDDLAMPTAAEEEARQKAEMEARLKLKAELKAKAAKPKTFQESMRAEQEKKKQSASMTKEERRNALCEDLGRGC